MLQSLAGWLASTSLSLKLQTVTWAIPDLQSVHIVALAQWDLGQIVPAGAKVAGALSLLLWIAIIVVGRWIGFI